MLFQIFSLILPHLLIYYDVYFVKYIVSQYPFSHVDLDWRGDSVYIPLL